ncbi:hypothetical protein [uncultured Trichococcus sp.]|uniref:NAD(P)H-dependent amine dehydrogenase family protein n=1 Tax=uncultured Trichococcus sp. TaxID=189665 RepID=UPI0029C6DECE|nr:hypothetical protein [uncultured Trichococcus sp.]
MTKKLKVVVIGTGNVAAIAIRCIQGREDMELVGVWAHRETAGHLVGTDAGLLDADQPCGVTITDNEEEIFELKPDCAICVINIRNPVVCDQVNGEWYKKFLKRGINVVSPSVANLIYPPACPDQEYIADISQTAHYGNASIYVNGQEPGFAEHLAMLAATCSNTIKTITTSEMFNYSTTQEREELTYAYGFDEPAEYVAALEPPEFQIACWGVPIRNVADKLGYKLEKITASFEKRVTEKDIEVGYGIIQAGKVAAVRLRTCGIVNGREAIVVEHINRMSQDIAPDWPMTDRVGQIRVVIEGDPNLQLDFNVGLKENPEELSYDGYVMTAMRIVNAIPYVCEAAAGIVTIHDLPLTTPSTAFRSDAVFVPHKVCKPKK